MSFVQLQKNETCVDFSGFLPIFCVIFTMPNVYTQYKKNSKANAQRILWLRFKGRITSCVVRLRMRLHVQIWH